jgi:hypothetical protein
VTAATAADLFLAILSLDAYNRGYNPGMVFAGNSDLIQRFTKAADRKRVARETKLIDGGCGRGWAVAGKAL